DLYVSHCAYGKADVSLAPSRLFRNEGGRFTDISAASGACPPNYEGRGLATLDFDGDGLLDLVTCEQYYSPAVKTGAALYRNKGDYRFENATAAAGLPAKFGGLGVAVAAGLAPLTMKAPHVEIQDFDNDGWPDIFVSIVKFEGGRPHPLIYKNLGVRDGIPRFREYAWGVNDFPTAEDRGLRRSGALFDKILKEKKIIYMAAGPSCDFDRDGRLDLLLPNWWLDSRTLLLRNETPGGHWLDVCVAGTNGVNRMGVGSRVNVYPAGKLGDAATLLGSREIAIGYGYCSGQEAVAHFGLGSETSVDVEVILPHGKGKITQRAVAADQRLTVKQ